jgi:hypothetical protein
MVMVNNTININKTNNPLSLTSTHIYINQTTISDVVNPGHGLGQAQRCGGVKSVKGIPTLL